MTEEKVPTYNDTFDKQFFDSLGKEISDIIRDDGLNIGGLGSNDTVGAPLDARLRLAKYMLADPSQAPIIRPTPHFTPPDLYNVILHMVMNDYWNALNLDNPTRNALFAPGAQPASTIPPNELGKQIWCVTRGIIAASGWLRNTSECIVLDNLDIAAMKTAFINLDAAVVGQIFGMYRTHKEAALGLIATRICNFVQQNHAVGPPTGTSLTQKSIQSHLKVPATVENVTFVYNMVHVVDPGLAIGISDLFATDEFIIYGACKVEVPMDFGDEYRMRLIQVPQNLRKAALAGACAIFLESFKLLTVLGLIPAVTRLTQILIKVRRTPWRYHKGSSYFLKTGCARIEANTSEDIITIISTAAGVLSVLAPGHTLLKAPSVVQIAKNADQNFLKGQNIAAKVKIEIPDTVIEAINAYTGAAAVSKNVSTFINAKSEDEKRKALENILDAEEKTVNQMAAAFIPIRYTSDTERLKDFYINVAETPGALAKMLIEVSNKNGADTLAPAIKALGLDVTILQNFNEAKAKQIEEHVASRFLRSSISSNIRIEEVSTSSKDALKTGQTILPSLPSSTTTGTNIITLTPAPSDQSVSSSAFLTASDASARPNKK